MNAPVVALGHCCHCRCEHHLLSAKQELSFKVDGAQHMKVLCVSQSDGQDDTVLGKACVQV